MYIYVIVYTYISIGVGALQCCGIYTRYKYISIGTTYIYTLYIH